MASEGNEAIAARAARDRIEPLRDGPEKRPTGQPG